MKRLHVDHDPVLIGFLAGILESRGVACVVKNAYLSGGAGELPPTECWPELWVREDADLPLARRILAQARADHGHHEAWICPVCGERLEGQFTDCWQCGTPGPGTSP